MAERRMFTQKIVDSDAFLDMPLSTQSLYFHLNMRADDDGFINNPKKIQRMIGASDDDLKLLIAKRFVLAFENGVVVIKHWRMHNLLRKDRYNPTQYIEQRETLLLKDNGSYTEKTSEQSCNQLATTWQPDGNQLATQERIGEESIVKESKGEGNGDEFCKQVADLFNSLCPSLPPVKNLTKIRKNKILKLLNTFSNDIDDYKILFAKVEKSDFLKGENNRKWSASFDWLIEDQNITKVIEGNYDNKPKQKKNSRYDFDAFERMAFDRVNAVNVKGNPELEKEAEELKKMLQETY